jgi:hypothetical protein
VITRPHEADPDLTKINFSITKAGGEISAENSQAAFVPIQGDEPDEEMQTEISLKRKRRSDSAFSIETSSSTATKPSKKPKNSEQTSLTENYIKNSSINDKLALRPIIDQLFSDSPSLLPSDLSADDLKFLYDLLKTKTKKSLKFISRYTSRPDEFIPLLSTLHGSITHRALKNQIARITNSSPCNRCVNPEEQRSEPQLEPIKLLEKNT